MFILRDIFHVLVESYFCLFVLCFEVVVSAVVSAYFVFS